MSFSEWKTYKVEELCRRIISGGTPSTTKKEYYDGDIPWLKTQEVNFNRIYDTDTKITKQGFENSSAKMIEPNSIIVAMYGATAAKLAINKIPLSTNQACCNLTVDEKKADYHFIYYYLRNEYSNLVNLTNGGAQQNLSSGVIKNFEIKAPDLKTQQRIASILSSLDDAIELNQQINKTLEEMAKAIFKEWFVNFNFPSTSSGQRPNATGKFQETEIGKIPVGWKVGKLGYIYKTTSGGTPSRAKLEYYKNGIYQWVKSKELDNSFIIDTEEKITADALKKSSAKLVPKYSVMIAMYGATVGEIGIISNEATCNQAICAFLPNIDYPFSFIYQFLLLNKQDIISQAVGSAQQNISQQLLLNYALVIPPSELVKAFHKIVEPLFFQIEQGINENQSLINLRDTLLPKLMKGEININL